MITRLCVVDEGNSTFSKEWNAIKKKVAGGGGASLSLVLRTLRESLYEKFHHLRRSENVVLYSLVMHYFIFYVLIF